MRTKPCTPSKPPDKTFHDGDGVSELGTITARVVAQIQILCNL